MEILETSLKSVRKWSVAELQTRTLQCGLKTFSEGPNACMKHKDIWKAIIPKAFKKRTEVFMESLSPEHLE